MSVITKTSIVKIFPSWENLHLESSAKSISFSEALRPPSSKIMHNSIQILSGRPMWILHHILLLLISVREQRLHQLNTVGFLKESFL